MIVSATDGHATLRLRPCTGGRRGEEDIVPPTQLSQDPTLLWRSQLKTGASLLAFE